MPGFPQNPPRPRVLVTRAPDQSSELAEALRLHGADPILIPAIELAPPSSWAKLDQALDHLHTFHWLLFTSANAVSPFLTRQALTLEAKPLEARTLQTKASTSGIPLPTASASLGVPLPPTPGNDQPPEPLSPVPEDSHRLSRLKIAAIGPATARALSQHGFTPDLTPPQAVAESLLEALLPHALQPDGNPTQFLLVRAEEARELLPEALRAVGAEVTVASAYRTVVPESSMTELQSLFRSGAEPPAAITFTSSSSARNLLALCEAAGVHLPEMALRISIGPITTQTLADLGLPPHAEAKQATVAALAAATAKALANR